MVIGLVTGLVTGLTTLGLTGCASTESTQPVIQSTTASITPEAQSLLNQAEIDVSDARSKFALWTTAESALLAAQNAAAVGDSASVIKHATFASSQVKLGLEQLKLPSSERKTERK
jgi:murein lipoprotein